MVVQWMLMLSLSLLHWIRAGIVSGTFPSHSCELWCATFCPEVRDVVVDVDVEDRRVRSVHEPRRVMLLCVRVSSLLSTSVFVTIACTIICMLINTCICMCMCIYIYIYIYIHIYLFMRKSRRGAPIVGIC